MNGHINEQIKTTNFFELTNININCIFFVNDIHERVGQILYPLSST